MGGSDTLLYSLCSCVRRLTVCGDGESGNRGSGEGESGDDGSGNHGSGEGESGDGEIENWNDGKIERKRET